MADATPHWCQPAAYRSYLRVLAGALLRSSDLLRGKVDPSDIVQETLLTAHAAQGNFRGDSPEALAAWLRRILANKVTDATRHFGRRKRDAALERRYVETLDDSSARFVGLVAADATSPSQALVRHERLLRLAGALDGLPVDQRRAIELHHLMGHTVAETAELLGRSRASVAGLLRRGLKALRSSLDAEPE